MSSKLRAVLLMHDMIVCVCGCIYVRYSRIKFDTILLAANISMPDNVFEMKNVIFVKFRLKENWLTNGYVVEHGNWVTLKNNARKCKLHRKMPYRNIYSKIVCRFSGCSSRQAPKWLSMKKKLLSKTWKFSHVNRTSFLLVLFTPGEEQRGVDVRCTSFQSERKSIYIRILFVFAVLASALVIFHEANYFCISEFAHLGCISTKNHAWPTWVHAE